MSNFRLLIKISRPRFWIYILGPFLIGLIAGVRNPAELFRLENILWGIYFLFPANLLIYGINDIFDYETDRSNPKKKDYEALVAPGYQSRLWFYLILFNLPFVFLGFIFSLNTLLVLALFLFFGVFYSAPPIRAKTKPYFDSAFNILYVFPGVFAYILSSDRPPSTSAVAAAGFWTMAMHAFSAIPDISSDRKANIRTIATQLENIGTLFFCLVCYGISTVLAYQFIGVAAYAFGLAYLIIITFAFTLSFKPNQSKRIFEIYRLFPILNTTVGFALFWVIAHAKFG